MRRTLSRAGQRTGERRSSSFEHVYDTYQYKVRSVLFRFGVSAENLDDLTQDVFEKIWRNLKGFRGQSALSTWVMRIAMNTAIDAVKRRSLSVAPGVDPDSTPALSGEESNTQIVEMVLAKLEYDLRAVLLLHVIEGYRLGEIAGILEIPEGTVKSRLHRARQRAAELLEGWGVSYE